ncbi:hypothetical protein [Nocardioides marmotae]|uniref:hypothetical protein n=1 Tax=Nocardioides marmotae TaxID=2663857 RepID=UPI0012B632E5|nr:hypothetical protein [Nocardioides marmotae]MBC9733553.1 hypothetical protein [Nocardioides marmotae]MTB84659.1 hypothetical protein [Nocardioides marmotae]
MSFPPHEVLQAEIMFYRLTGIVDDVNKLIAGSGLTAEVAHTRDLQYVKVPLVNGRSVGLVAATNRFPGAWVIAWPTTSTCDANRIAWPLDTDSHLIAKIMAAVVNDALPGRGLPMPFRWGRVETSAIVELADRLVARGVDRDAVQLTPLVTLNDDGHPKSADGNLNELRLSDRNDPDRTLCIGLHPKVGWSADQIMARTGGSGRLDLASALGLETALPRVGADAVTLNELAQLLIVDTGWDDVSDGYQLRRYCVTPEEASVYSKRCAEQAAVAWLRWAGVIPADRRGGQDALTSTVELHVDYTEKQIGIGGVQRYKGVAAVSGLTPVVVARSGFSKQARSWAEAAEMLLFTLDEDGVLRPANDLAAGYTPREIGSRPRTCDDRSCMTFGCVMDDEFCFNNRGRYSDPDAEGLRL